MHQIRTNLFQCHSRSVLSREYHCINPLWLAVYIFYGYLCLAIWTEILQNLFFSYIGQLHAELMCERNCQRHQFLCFLARITEHHTLVTSTGFLMFAAPAFIGIVDTHCDIRRLLVHCLQNRAGVAIEAKFCTVIADVYDDIPSNLRNVHFCSGRDFAHAEHHTSCNNGFAGNSCFAILFEDCIQNSIRNLVTDFIRMSFGYGLRGKQKTIHEIPSSFQV